MAASLVAGIVLGLSAGFSPGPFLTLVISHSLAHGAREGVKVALAPLITDVPIVLLSILVLARLAGFHLLLGGITFAGGLFLAYLAYESFKITGFDLDTPCSKPQSLRRGVLVNFLNPHPYLFWLTVGSPIIIKGWAVSPFNAAGFLAGFYGCLVGSKVLVAVSVGRSRHFFTGKPYVYVMRILGVLLSVFALLLFWEALEFLGVLNFKT
ncbi:MAG TPA: LysE family translocator [Candidatus Hydrogenedentes bacterium]|nr:LysE family translocator [Candidatus Hydrogenedentota bacterium]